MRPSYRIVSYRIEKKTLISYRYRIESKKSLSLLSDRDLLLGDQRSVLLADSEAAPWVGVLADDERVDRQQRQQHVPSLPVEDGRVLAKSNSMKLCMTNCKTPVKGQHRSILMVSNEDKDTLYIRKICDPEIIHQFLTFNDIPNE